MKTSNKDQVVGKLAKTQVVYFVISLVVLAFLIRFFVNDIVRKQIMSNNMMIAEQMAASINQQKLKSIKIGTPGWESIQGMIEKGELPNNGYMCVADVSSGGLICHPDLRANPELSKMNLMKWISSRTKIDQKELVRKRTKPLSLAVKGGKETQVLSIANMKGLNAVLLVHQSELGYRKAVNSVLVPACVIALLLGLGFIAVNKSINHEIISSYENEIEGINVNLEQLVLKRTDALTKTRDAVIFGLAKLAESRDTDTGEHLERIRFYVNQLAAQMADSNSEFDQNLLANIGLASSLHDIGKVGVPDGVLLKPGRLTEKEREVIETHPLVGIECLHAIEDRLGEDNFLSLATEICGHHHEKWDGSGYPFGLSGDSIPVSARIVALADVYDALRSERPYKKAMSHEKARKIIVEGSGAHFDPAVVEAFLICEPIFERFSNEQLRLEGTQVPQECESTETASFASAS